MRILSRASENFPLCIHPPRCVETWGSALNALTNLIRSSIGKKWIVALTGLVLTSNTGSSNTKAGELWELDAIAACVIGGVSLRGGRGNVLGVIFGALIIAILINGMNLLAVSTANQYLARGAVLIAAVWMDVRMKRA